jgi:hypothetical protein
MPLLAQGWQRSSATSFCSRSATCSRATSFCSRAGALHSLAEKENSYFQLLGAFAFLGAAVLFVASYARSSGEGRRARNPRVKRLSYLLLALAFFVATGEELSWGQHAVGFDTPEGLSDVNRQNETNFHNLEALKGAPDQLFTAFWFGFTILVPLIALASGSARRRLGRLLPIMPLAFGVLFALNYAASKVAEAYTSGHLQHSVVEIKESNFGVLFLLVALYVVVELSGERQ